MPSRIPMDDELRGLVDEANRTIAAEGSRTGRQGLIERSTRAEIRAMGADLATSALARAAIDLAQRLDLGPTDRDATALSRELRLVLAALHERHDQVAGGELDGFLAGISAPALRQPGD